ncbi:MAG: DUF2274 domain-containing protein [Pseudomonadota bacterium]
MSQAKLKVGPLVDQTPVKLSISCDPELHADLADYAKVHSRAFGKDVTVAELAPHMLRALMDGDAVFKRSRRIFNQA